jgi:hypothetical protein
MIHQTGLPRRGLRRGLALVGAALALTMAGSGARAQPSTEPHNNTNPNSSNKGFVLYAQGGSSASGLSLTPTGDVDWFVLVCSQTIVSDSPRFVHKVSINFNHDAGDLDMDVFTPWENLIGGSSGVTNQEEFIVTGNVTTVFLKVYGYAGATGDYSVSYQCR